MINKCPQYKYSLEEQKKRFPFFNKKDYKDLSTLQKCICKICKNETLSHKCKYEQTAALN